LCVVRFLHDARQTHVFVVRFLLCARQFFLHRSIFPRAQTQLLLKKFS
jgi:hypothetical protein